MYEGVYFRRKALFKDLRIFTKRNERVPMIYENISTFV